jgi:hypothetical protein
LFGSEGPPVDLEERNDALSNLNEESTLGLEVLAQEYFDYREDHLALMQRFVVLHKSAFTSVAS